MMVNSSTVSNCSVEPQHVSVTVLLTLVFLVGFGFNIFCLWVFCYRVRHWNSGTILQFNLALSDALAAPATTMVAVYFANDASWKFGRGLCVVKITLLTVHFFGSIFFLMLISIHRYVAVVHFNRRNLMKQKSFVKKLCGGIWILALAQGVIYAAVLPSTKQDSHMQCLNIHQDKLTDAYFAINFVFFIIGFLLPFSVSVICYCLLASSVSQISTSTVHGPAVKAKSLRMITVCIVIIGLCFLPLNITRTIAVVMKKFYSNKCDALDHVEAAYYVCWIFAGINCSLDPLIYFFGSNSFRTVIRRSLKVLQVEKDNDNRNETISHTGRGNTGENIVNNETTS